MEYLELKSKLSDQMWRLNNLYIIQDKAGQAVPFRMNWAQEELVREMHFLNIILKARQLGFTTFIDIFILDCCIFNSNTRGGIIAHTRDDAEEIFRTKVKFPYEHLPEGIRGLVRATQDSARQLTFSNGSSVRVGTSMRSGTLNYLHVSEHGKICARYPEKAKEIRTGALNAVEAGQFAFIESTAEGREGDFYKLCETAKAKALSGAALTPLDFKFHFFPWWRNPAYRLDPQGVPIPAPLAAYFADLELAHGVRLDDAQRAWYAKKTETQGEEMKREYPSIPEEAFEAAIEGAYYGMQMARVRKEGRICRVPYEPSIPVNTFWDLGMDDSTTVWFHQRVGKENRFIHYYQNHGEDLPHYVGYLRGLGYTIWGDHFLPHDVQVRSLNDRKTRKQVLEENGLRPVIVVPRTDSLGDDIEMVRQALASCWFDEEECSAGINALENYRKEWDEKMGVFKSYPRHDWASHGADGFRPFATAYRHRDSRPGVVQAQTNFDPLRG